MLRLTLILPLLFAMLVRAAAAQTEVAAVPFIQWEKFVDPNEGSFWMEVPSGWRISSGLARRNALQFWPWLTAVSPDGDNDHRVRRSQPAELRLAHPVPGGSWFPRRQPL